MFLAAFRTMLITLLNIPYSSFDAAWKIYKRWMWVGGEFWEAPKK